MYGNATFVVGVIQYFHWAGESCLQGQDTANQYDITDDMDHSVLWPARIRTEQEPAIGNDSIHLLHRAVHCESGEHTCSSRDKSHELAGR